MAAKKPAKKAPAKKRAARASAPLTVTQATVLEAQFATRIKDLNALDAKLAEVEGKFDPSNDTLVPSKVREARAKIAVSRSEIEDALEVFSDIGIAMRSFFG